MAKVDNRAARKRRHYRVRNKIEGTPNRPRLNVYKSLNNLYAQVIDDISGHTLASASTLDSELKDYAGKATVGAGEKVGELVAKRSEEKGVTEVVFDRGGFPYHGKVKAIAEGARNAGLKL